VVGAEFRGRVHEGSFGVLGPKFKRVFLVGVSGGGSEFRVYRNYEGREFNSRTRLVVGWAVWLGPSSEGGFMRGVSGFLGRSSSGFSWSESAGRERVRNPPQLRGPRVRLADPTGCGQGGVVGAEFRGRVHEGSFGVLGPKFKRVFLVGVSGGGNEFGVGRQL